MILTGLDIETTGLHQAHHHRLIQIGIAVSGRRVPVPGLVLGVSTTPLLIGKDVRPSGIMVMDPGALAINKFTPERIAAAESAAVVDLHIHNTLRLAGILPDTLVPVGWNVVAFDMPFIAQELPLTAKYFTYASDSHSTRAVDLTALGLALEDKTGKSYADIKKHMKDICAKTLGRRQEHDALYDAQSALIAYDHFGVTLNAD